MANFNKVILAGNLTRDPQLSYTPSQTAVCEFGMAINRKWKDKEETCFVDLQAWGKTGETINQYCSKGSPLLVEGRLTFDQWEGKDGQRRSRLRVTVENFQFLGGRQDSQGEAPHGQRQPAPPMGGSQAPTPGQYGPANTRHQPPPASTPPPSSLYEGEHGPGGDNIPF